MPRPAAGLSPWLGLSLPSFGEDPAALPLFTYYPLSQSGFARLNRLLTRRAGSGKEEDPVRLLLEEGWDGGRVAVFDPALLPRLMERSVRGIRAALVAGLPFRSMLTRRPALPYTPH